CVAATHDIGFERDQRNNGLTHKIDPAIDGEREYVNDTLSATGLVVARDHVLPKDALTEAKTATGGSFHSDGRLVVLVLKPGMSASAAN
ncbi:MAG: LssY C-terminal domain-containing protein, partial [Terriglobia bacterium]